MTLEEQFKSETGEEFFEGLTAEYSIAYVKWLEKRAAVEDRVKAIDWGLATPCFFVGEKDWYGLVGLRGKHHITAPTLSELCDKAEALLKEGKADD